MWVVAALVAALIGGDLAAQNTRRVLPILAPLTVGPENSIYLADRDNKRLP